MSRADQPLLRRVAAAVAASAAVWAALHREETDRPGAGVRLGQPAASGFARWKAILFRIWDATVKHRVILVAAGVTFYGLLALFPAITALVSIYGLFADPQSITEQVQSLSTLLPGGAITVIEEQMRRIASQSGGRLGFALAAGLLVAVWSANSGMKAIFEGLNVANDTEERRGFFKLTATTLLFTLAALLAVIVALGAIVVVPAVLQLVGLGALADILVRYGRWLLLLGLIAIGFSLLYRYGPDRPPPGSWKWLSPGGVVAAVVWVAISVLFSWYVANFGSYNETYGSLGAVIGFMVWLWISATIILIGAQLDAELDRDPRPGTGHPRPLPQ